MLGLDNTHIILYLLLVPLAVLELPFNFAGSILKSDTQTIKYHLILNLLLIAFYPYFCLAQSDANAFANT